MTKILDRGVESTVADDIMDLLNERGYSVTEAIPGLISAVIDLADASPDTDQILDEAADLLSNAGVNEDGLENVSSDDDDVDTWDDDDGLDILTDDDIPF